VVNQMHSHIGIASEITWLWNQMLFSILEVKWLLLRIGVIL